MEMHGEKTPQEMVVQICSSQEISFHIICKAEKKSSKCHYFSKGKDAKFRDLSQRDVWIVRGETCIFSGRGNFF